jgi:hypothetical protein
MIGENLMSQPSQPTGRDPDTLPTSTDPSGTCPRCGRAANFSLANLEPLRIVGIPPSPQGGSGGIRVVEQVTVLQCMGCEQKSVVIEAEIGNRTGRTGVMWWPTDHLADLERVAGVPSEIVEAYSEGVRCLSVQSPNAAAAMFRTNIAQIVENKGSDAAKAKGTLNARIIQMVQDKTLWDDFGDWAHHIRDTGNAGAHGEQFHPVTMDQATELKTFIREMINFLYEQPARRASASPVTKKGTTTATTATTTTPPASGSHPTGTVGVPPGSGQA